MPTQSTHPLIVLCVATAMLVVPVTGGLAGSTETTPTADEAATDAAALPYDGLVPAIEDRFAGQDDVSFAEAIELSQLVGQHQATTLNADLALDQPVPEHGSPSQAAIALAELHDAELTADQRNELQALDDLGDPLRTELTDTIDAFLAFYIAAETAYGPSTPLGDHGAVFTARNLLLDAVGDLHAVLPTSQTLSAPSVTVAPFLAVDLDGADSTYTEDIVLVIDAGGDDNYHNNAGGNVAAWSLAAALVDLGNGTDEYGNPEDPRANGVNGGGDNGAGVLVDAGGTDTYAARHDGVNGGGNTAGSGFLLDRAGDDTYGTLSNQGVPLARKGANGGVSEGPGGSGALVDSAGNDNYQAWNAGVNGGGNDAGAGLLVDLAGNDDYVGGHSGANGGVGQIDKYSFPIIRPPVPDIPVSQGLLFDANGTDRYEDDHIGDPDGDPGVAHDRTIVPKGGVIGAQVDSDDPPGAGPP